MRTNLYTYKSNLEFKLQDTTNKRKILAEQTAKKAEEMAIKKRPDITSFFDTDEDQQDLKAIKARIDRNIEKTFKECE